MVTFLSEDPDCVDVFESDLKDCEAGVAILRIMRWVLQDLSDPEILARIGNRAVKTVNKPSSEFTSLSSLHMCIIVIKTGSTNPKLFSSSSHAPHCK